MRKLKQDRLTWNIVSLVSIMVALRDRDGEDHREAVTEACDKAFTTGDTDVVLVTPNRFLNVLTHAIPEDVMSELRIALSGATYIEL